MVWETSLQKCTNRTANLPTHIDSHEAPPIAALLQQQMDSQFHICDAQDSASGALNS